MHVRQATPEDVHWMSSRLRLDDVREIVAGSAMAPVVALSYSLLLSERCYVICPTEGAGPVAIFGVGPTQYDGFGSVWMLATEEVGRHARGVIEVSRKALEEFSELYPLGLHNFVLSSNELHVRWCKLLGFDIGETIYIRGQPFIHITYRSKQCVTS